MKKLTFLLFFIAQMSYAQTKVINETIKKIEIEQDTVRAVFEWVADNIRYDVRKLNKIKSGTKSKRKKKFESQEERQAYLVSQAIDKKRGVCQDYSLIFTAILTELGIESYVIRGYSKNKEGKVSLGGHTWNVAKVNGSWKLYDPTWGAGYVKEKRFVKKYNEKWYETDPTEMIKRHMPYDPMWQLLANPVSYAAFDSNNESLVKESNYDVAEIVNDYVTIDRKKQMKDEVSRSRSMGDGNELVEKWRKGLDKKINMYGISNQRGMLKEMSETATHALKIYKDYTDAKRKNFRSNKWTFDYTNQQLLLSKQKLGSVIEKYKAIEVDDKKTMESMAKTISYYERMEAAIDKEIVYLENREKN